VRRTIGVPFFIRETVGDTTPDQRLNRGKLDRFTLDALVNTPASLSADDRLAVYGSLAPGKSNHHMLARYAGTWSRGRVRGDLVNAGWGAAGGFPALIPRDDGPWVDVQVFESPDLCKAWPELDEFEGHEYERTVVPVYSEELDSHVLFDANIYALARTRRA